MIAYLRGVLIVKEEDGRVVIDVGGVGYEVAVTAAAWRALPDPGREAQLYVHTHAVQDGGLQLYGFPDPEGRRLFATLLGVQGVGPKVALAILSGLSLPDLVQAVARGDVTRLTQIRGVGRKTAERLAMELRDKIGPTAPARLAVVGVGGGGAPPGKLGEVYGALLALGYRPSELERVMVDLDPAEAPADLVKKALAVLRSR